MDGGSSALLRDGSRGEHFFDGADTGDGLFGEGKSKGNRTDEFPADVDRTATHALHNSRLFEARCEEASEDHALPGAAVLKHAKDAYREFFRGLPAKDSECDPFHVGLDSRNGEDRRLREGEGYGDHENCEISPHFHIILSLRTVARSYYRTVTKLSVVP